MNNFNPNNSQSFGYVAETPTTDAPPPPIIPLPGQPAEASHLIQQTPMVNSNNPEVPGITKVETSPVVIPSGLEIGAFTDKAVELIGRLDIHDTTIADYWLNALQNRVGVEMPENAPELLAKVRQATQEIYIKRWNSIKAERKFTSAEFDMIRQQYELGILPESFRNENRRPDVGLIS